MFGLIQPFGGIVKKWLLSAALFCLPANIALADTASENSHALAGVTTSCPGKILSALPDYNIQAGILIGRLEPGGVDPDGNPTSYKTYDKEGHSIFLPADKVQLLFCVVRKSPKSNGNGPDYTLTFNPPMEKK